MESSSCRVECYSGRRYGERPVAFAWGGKRHTVSLMERQWREPRGPGFDVKTEGGLRFRLRYRLDEDTWSIAPMRG